MKKLIIQASCVWICLLYEQLDVGLLNIDLCTLFIYTMSQKNKTPNFCSYLRQILTDFQNSFTATHTHYTLSRKFAIKFIIKIPPHLKHVATLPCEILALQVSVSLCCACYAVMTVWRARCLRADLTVYSRRKFVFARSRNAADVMQKTLKTAFR